MAELHHECGVVAVYHLPADRISRFAPPHSSEEKWRDPDRVSEIVPRLLLDIQNRGQLAAGFTTYKPGRQQLIDTHKDVGSVTEVFKLDHPAERRELLDEYAGPAAVGHVRYATCGKDDRSYAQPFERHHIQKSKWFAFAFNGQLANYQQLREEILDDSDFHLARETDTEILMHLLSQELTAGPDADLFEAMQNLSQRLDGCYNIVLLTAAGEMMVARDPLGVRPLCIALEDGDKGEKGPLFAAASESVALSHLGFRDEEIESLQPGEMILIRDGKIERKRFAESRRRAHCFFEWIYFANVASTLDEQSVYLTRKHLGEELARIEHIDVSADDCIVVPVPDTAKAAATSMAYEMGIPVMEGLIRNRYVGRTFIESEDRAAKVRMKFTPLPEVLEGKRVFLVEDSIVRSTTMKALISQLRDRGRAKEIHVRVACPPIVAPCFYGIDMSTVGELFAPKHMKGEDPAADLTLEAQQQMAEELEADSLRYLPIESIAYSLKMPASDLCQACIDKTYPTPGGLELYQIALEKHASGEEGRTYDSPSESEPVSTVRT